MPKADGSFKRARTDEQKQARMEAILLAADTLLDVHAYRDITMTMIADGLGFSRANLVHYVATKEEIFLRLYVRDIEALAADGAVYQRNEAQRIPADAESGEDDGGGAFERFARFFATACMRRRNFGRIGALLTTIIETNVDVEALTACKRRIYAAAETAATQIARLFGFLAPSSAMELIMATTHYVSGLYPAAHPKPEQIEAMRNCGIIGCEETAQPFEPALERFLVVQLTGYRELARR